MRSLRGSPRETVEPNGPLKGVAVKNGDDGCVRNLSSRPKSIRIPGKTPTVHDNEPVERRAADTAWNNTAKEN